MDRENAIRLLKALVAAGANSKTPMANVWVRDVALRDVSLKGYELVSALTYAGNEGWLTDSPQKGWTSLTSAGEAMAQRS